MQNFITLFLVVCCHCLRGQYPIDTVNCDQSEEDYEKLFVLEKEGDLEEQWQWYLESTVLDSTVSQLSWEWIELGPKGTPPEGQESKALRESYHGRGNGTGRINNLFINKSNERHVFACSPTGGLFYSRNKGRKWKSAGTDALPITGVSTVSVNPNNSSEWIIGTGDGDDRFIFSDGVYRTGDRGDSWEKINGFGEFKLPVDQSVFGFHISEVVSHPCDFSKQILATNKGLFKSSNALDQADSVRWKLVSDERFYDVEFHPLNNNIVMAGGENLLLSTSCGASWEKIERPDLPDKEKYGLVRMSIEMSKGIPNMALIAITRKKELGQGGIGESFLFEFDIEEKTWEKVTSLKKYAGNLIPTRARAFELSPTNDSLLLVGNVKPVHVSKDRGRTFERISKNQMHDDIHDFEFFSDGKTVLASHDGGVSISYDTGLTWKAWDDGIGAANVHGLAVSQTLVPVVSFGSYDCGTTLYKNEEWVHVGFGDGFQSVIHSKDSSKMVLSMQNGSVYASSDSGDQFNESIKMRGMKSSWHTWIQGNLSYPDILYQSGSTLIRSTDFGENWGVIFDPKIQSDNKGKAWRFYQTDGFPDQMFLLVLGEGRKNDMIYYTNNVNDSIEDILWEKIPELPRESWVSTILSSSRCASCHYLGFNTYDLEGKVFYFDGESYSDISGKMRYASIRSGVVDRNAGRIYLGTKAGVYTRLPDDSEWQVLTGLPSVRIRSMKINYKTKELFIGTFGRGVWKGKLIEE